MYCVIKDSQLGKIELDSLRNVCFVDVNLWDEPDSLIFMLQNEIFYILLENQWIDIMTFSSNNVIVNSLDISDILTLKYIVSEALKWPEIWHCMD